MWLRVWVLALLFLGSEAAQVSIRSVDADANVGKAARFLGIAYNLLKADPDAEGGDVVDPGFVETRRVVDLDPAHQVSFPRHSCETESSTSTVYDEESFQKKFDKAITIEGSVNYKLVEARFALSNSYSDAKAQTTIGRTMTLETQTLCNLGSARLQTVLNSHRASEEFQAAVCQLPDTYDQAAYVRFIDDWGTNFVVNVVVGIRNLTKKTETFSSVFESLARQVGGGSSVSGTYNGVIATVSGSIELNMNRMTDSQELQQAFKGREIIKTIGSVHYPEPIKVELGNLEAMVSSDRFTAPNPSACTAAALAQLSTKRANLARALAEYPKAKNVVITPSHGTVRIPLSWPYGTYGLLKPKGSCPSGWASDGQRTWDCENKKKNIVWATPGNHIDGVIARDVQLRFCVKTDPLADSQTSLDWPEGEYCFFQYRECPAGFEEGSIYWDDQDGRNINSVTGVVPDGKYGRNTLVYFCCRTDGHSEVPIFLPTEAPFYLLQATQYGCQKVHGMNVESEEVQWDDENWRNDNEAKGKTPYKINTNKKNWRLFFCYYSKR